MQPKELRKVAQILGELSALCGTKMTPELAADVREYKTWCITQSDALHITWNSQDVRSTIEEDAENQHGYAIGVEATDELCAAVLTKVERQLDSEQGVTWDTIRNACIEVIAERYTRGEL